MIRLKSVKILEPRSLILSPIQTELHNQKDEIRVYAMMADSNYIPLMSSCSKHYPGRSLQGSIFIFSTHSSTVVQV